MAIYPAVRLNAAGVVDSNSVGSVANILVSDNNRATLNSSADWVEVGPFDFSGLSGDEIVSIKIGVEGNSDGGSGSSPNATISYQYNTVTGATTSTFSVDNNSPTDQEFPAGLLDITGDRAWLLTDGPNFVVRLERDSANLLFRDIDADHLFAEVVTQDTPVAGGVNEIHRYTVGTTPINVIPSGNIGAVAISIKAHPDNTSLLLMSHTDDPFDDADTITIEPGQPTDPRNISSSLFDPVELWVKGLTGGQQVEVAIYRDEEIILQQDANALLSTIAGLFALP